LRSAPDHNRHGGGDVIPRTVTCQVIVDCALGDDADPVAICRDRTYTIQEGETRNINAGQVDDGSFDGYSALAGGAIDITGFTCSDEGPNTVTLTVGDLNGQVVQPNNEPVYVRLYCTNAELMALQNAAPGSNQGTFSVMKTSDLDIDRSVDGRTFEYVGAVAGAGDSFEERGYRFVDEHPVTGMNYYRLRQEDLDGAEALSDVRQVMIEGAKNVSVYPNPNQSSQKQPSCRPRTL
jgi:hypothetical protein